MRRARSQTRLNESTRQAPSVARGRLALDRCLRFSGRRRSHRKMTSRPTTILFDGFGAT
jgi:hypothetical protein